MKQKNNRVKFGAMVLAVAFLISVAGLAQAVDSQAVPVVVASVNVYEAKVVSQEGNKLTVSFDINNRSDIQPGIKYGIELKRITDGKQSGQLISRVFDETLVLRAGETIHREMVFDVPEYADGSYEVNVVSENEKGMTLGLGIAGNATFKSNGAYININAGSCSLIVKEEEKNKKIFLPLQGVDIDQGETLLATCELENNSEKTIQGMLKMVTYFRNTYGALIDTDYGDQISVGPKEKKRIFFSLPKAEKPQAYDVVISLVNEEKKDISNEEIFHYVLRGASGTIQNVRLDKESYQKGEIAKVSFFWTGAADSFPDSRKGASQVGAVKIETRISDKDDKLCAPVLEKETKASESSFMELQTVMESNCQFPKVFAIMKDSSGSILDQTTFSLENEIETDNLNVTENAPNEESAMWLIIGIIALAPLVLLGIFLIAKKTKSLLTIFFLVFGFMLLFSGKAEADTIVWRGATYTVNYNNAEYEPGETITATGIVTAMSVCSNQHGAQGSLKGYFPETNPPVGGNNMTPVGKGEPPLPDSPIIFLDVSCQATTYYSCPYPIEYPEYCGWVYEDCSALTAAQKRGTLSGIVANVPGTHYGYFSGKAHYLDNYDWSPFTQIPYTVIMPDPSVQFNIDGNPSSIITVGQPANLRWYVKNANWCKASSDHIGSDGGWTVSGDDIKDSTNEIWLNQYVSPTDVGTYVYKIKCGDSIKNKETPWQEVFLTVAPVPICSTSLGSWGKVIGAMPYADLNDQVPFSWNTNDYNNNVDSSCLAGITISPNPLVRAGNNGFETITSLSNPKDKKCTLTVKNEANVLKTCETPTVCVRNNWDNYTCEWGATSNCSDSANCGKQVVSKTAYCWADDLACLTGRVQRTPLSLCDTAISKCADIMENCPPCGQRYKETN